MTSLEAQFWQFAQDQRIPTKDRGVVAFRPWGTQKYAIGQIFAGLQEGIHDFWIDKARQVGLSTATWLLDAFWACKFPGTQGQIITDSDDNMAVCRDTFGEVVRSIPAKWKPRGGILFNNRNLMRLGNGSRLMYQVAGLREKGKSRLGRSRGVSYLHATEVAYWGDEAGVKALRGSLSQQNPHRLYIWESTANGFNFFYEMYQDAGKAVTKRQVFVGWWLHELYRVHPSSKIYQTYWASKAAAGRLTANERAKARHVQQAYGIEITPVQWAWYRCQLAEEMGDDQVTMDQEFPTIPEDSFQATGHGFLGPLYQQRLRERLKDAPPEKYYRYEWGPQIEDSQLVECSPQMAQLTVWEEPNPEQTGHYVVACDPSYGRHGDADNCVISVWKASRTRLTQVAEFASNETGLRNMAWASCHLLGVYPVSYFILELANAGWGIWEEINRLRDYGFGTAKRESIQHILAGVRHYVYRKPDSMGAGLSWQWITNANNRPRLFERLRDHVVNGSIVIRSPSLVSELASVRQEKDDYFAEGKASDDRVLSAALAIEMWQGQVAAMLAYLPESSDIGQELEARQAPHAGERAVRGIFDRLVR